MKSKYLSRLLGIVTVLGIAGLALPLSAHAGGPRVSVGIDLPLPVPFLPFPVVVAPQPVIVHPAPVVRGYYGHYHHGYDRRYYRGHGRHWEHDRHWGHAGHRHRPWRHHHRW
jgi:hypothetical protein